MLALANPGDEIIYPDPGFPIYESAIRFAGATPVPIALREERDFAFDLDELAAKLGPRTKLVILNSPHNPTGGVLSAAGDRGRAALIAQDRRLGAVGRGLLADGLRGRHSRRCLRAGMLERTILLDGCSKTFAMTGWRCGFARCPSALVDPLVRFFTNSTSCVPPFVQLAAIAALEGPMDEPGGDDGGVPPPPRLIVGGLTTFPGVSCREPAGAFYAFPNVAGTGRSAAELAGRLLEEPGVAVLAGTAFGAVGRGQPAALLRELGREHRIRARGDQGVSRLTQAGSDRLALVLVHLEELFRGGAHRNVPRLEPFAETGRAVRVDLDERRQLRFFPDNLLALAGDPAPYPDHSLYLPLAP